MFDMKKIAISSIILLFIFTGCNDNSKPNDSDEPDENGPATAEDYIKFPFADEFNSNEIDNSVWQIATWVEHGGQTGTERCFVKDGYLNLVFMNDSEKGYWSAAIQSRDEFLFGRWEARLKPSSFLSFLLKFTQAFDLSTLLSVYEHPFAGMGC